ncbi:MAG: hypothetical protein IPP36_02765 [Nitrosomonadales bacterium]|nr:hypothetical protein [Nitrosomonadales bacterium]
MARFEKPLTILLHITNLVKNLPCCLSRQLDFIWSLRNGSEQVGCGFEARAMLITCPH